MSWAQPSSWAALSPRSPRQSNTSLPSRPVPSPHKQAVLRQGQRRIRESGDDPPGKPQPPPTSVSRHTPNQCPSASELVLNGVLE